MKPAKPVTKQPVAKKRGATTAFEAKKTGGQGPSIGEKRAKAIRPTGINAPQKQADSGLKERMAEIGKATQFKPGVSPNPGGKPLGARNRLQGDFMRELSEDFAENGKTAIVACRTDKPDVYVKIVASLMPKELAITRPLDDLTDDELDNAIALLRERLIATSGTGKGTEATQIGKAARAVPALH